MEAPMSYENIRLNEEGDFAVVTMCRPERRNALSEAHLRELLDAFETVGRSDARGVVLAGEGPAFCAGHDFMQLLQRLPQPVIAQVDGIATAAGCQLVASCDLAVAAQSARFQTPGGRGGWFCHTPGVALARAVGRKQALEMLFTGDPIDAQTALAWGLVNRVVPEDEVAWATRDLLRRAAGLSRRAKARGKATFYAHVDLGVAEAYALATEVMAETSQSAHARERMRSFVEKRQPDFSIPEDD
jgi:enoyl-CoA hydratase/carnithine racemase